MKGTIVIDIEDSELSQEDFSDIVVGIEDIISSYTDEYDLNSHTYEVKE